MKKFLVLFTICFLSLAPAYSGELSRAELENIVINSVKADTVKKLKQYNPDEIDVKITNNPITAPIVTENEIKVEVKSHNDKFMQYDIKKVVVKENNKTIRVLPVSVKIDVYKNVLVAKDFISQFGVINSTNTYKKKMEVANTIKEVKSELSEPLVATRNISKNGLILNCYTKAKPDVVRNSYVKILFKKGENFNIEMDGIALKEGRCGDIIVVKNAKYNKMYSATVIETNKVEVQL